MKTSNFPPIFFVTGKGGVGKSFVSALLARQLSAEGKRVLVVEMGSWSYLQGALGLDAPACFTPQPSSYGFDVVRWLGGDCLRDYINYIVKVPLVGDAFLKNSWLQALIQVAPGLQEISFLGKITSGLREHGPALEYDHIIIDAVSSGHFLSLIQTPKGLSEVVKVGPMRTQSLSILDILNNSEKVKTYVVTNLEAYSVQESIELQEQIQKRIKSPIQIIANKVFPVPEPPTVTSSAAVEFVKSQVDLKNFQSEQQKKFEQQGDSIIRIPFFFKSLKQCLGAEDENCRLFQNV